MKDNYKYLKGISINQVVTQNWLGARIQRKTNSERDKFVEKFLSYPVNEASYFNKTRITALFSLLVNDLLANNYQPSRFCLNFLNRYLEKHALGVSNQCHLSHLSPKASPLKVLVEMQILLAERNNNIHNYVLNKAYEDLLKDEIISYQDKTAEQVKTAYSQPIQIGINFYQLNQEIKDFVLKQHKITSSMNDNTAHINQQIAPVAMAPNTVFFSPVESDHANEGDLENLRAYL
jgi:hypothetical protein